MKEMLYEVQCLKSFVFVHQHCDYDVTLKPPIESMLGRRKMKSVMCARKSGQVL